MFKKCLISILLIFLLMSIPVIGAPTYVNLGPLSYIGGDIGVPADKGYYIGDVLFSTAGLVDISTLAKTDGGIIVGDGTNFVLETGDTARASLGLTIGTHVQAYDAGLTSLAGLTYASPSFIKVTATDTYAIRTIAEVITDLALDSDDLSDVASIAMLDENEVITGAWTVTGSIAGVDATEFGYLDGITSDLQTQLNAKLETEVDPTVDTDAEIKAILVNEVTKTGTFTAGKIAKINNANGIIEQGTNTDTDVADAVTKKHAQNTDTDLNATFEATFVKKTDTVNVLSDITSAGANIEDAVTKRHAKNTDTDLDSTFELTFAKKANKLNVFAATTSAELAGVISDETGTDKLVYNTSPTLVTPNIGVAQGTSLNTTGKITSSGTAGIGYASGAGGTVTQVTSKAVGVTINKVCGEITTASSALSASQTVSFQVNNNLVAATDIIYVQHASGGTGGAYILMANRVVAGSFYVSITNHTDTTLSQAIKIGFIVIKAVIN